MLKKTHVNQKKPLRTSIIPEAVYGLEQGVFSWHRARNFRKRSGGEVHSFSMQHFYFYQSFQRLKKNNA